MTMRNENPCSCSRRSFLRGSGLTLAGFSVASLFPSAFMNHAMAGGTGDERLLFIFLRGGNDGINSTIPHGDPQYNPVSRGALYITPAQAHDLNGFASLHPALGDMMDVYNAGDLAVIHRVGYPDQSQSHFTGQRIWENGSPGQSDVFDGWLARYIAEQAAQFDGDLPAITAQRELPVLMRSSQNVFVNISDATGFYAIEGKKQDKMIRSWRQVLNKLGGPQTYRPLLAQTGLGLMDSLNEYRSWNQALWNPKDPNNPTWSLFPVNIVTNPPDPSGPNGLKFSPEAYPFFQDLKIAALALLESQGTSNGTRVSGTELSGFDLHTNAGSTSGRHAELLSWLGYGFRSLQIVLSGAAIDPRAYSSIWDKTTVVTMSEFGRTSLTNGGKGTDHAKASCMWLAGGKVNGGVYNCDSSGWPSGVMFDVDGRYLSHATDFRTVFWEILRDHMGSPPLGVESVFPGYTAAGLPGQELGLIDTN